ncbi:MAG TPA: TRL domain-containing protein [Planctomycetota bacterium]|nr:TRL domain-containing protein [Planctomycetota bacterium]
MFATPAGLLLALLLAAPLAGCASPATQGIGLLRTSVRGPLVVSDRELPAEPKRGMSEVYTFLGLFAYGDGTVDAAMRQGGLTTLHHADYEYECLLGLLAIRRTFAYGD